MLAASLVFPLWNFTALELATRGDLCRIDALDACRRTSFRDVAMTGLRHPPPPPWSRDGELLRLK
jgi:hypothetical protein